jgi:hypothetical protein
MATKFTYKMRSGGNGMWGRGPAQRKNNLIKKKIKKKELCLNFRGWVEDTTACEFRVII